jgi:hypothetical protein
VRIFDNTHVLTRPIILRRLQSIDAAADCKLQSVEREDKTICRYVGVDSDTLTDAQIESCLGPVDAEDVTAEATERDRQEWLLVAKEKYAEVKRHIIALETAANIKWPAFVPEPWE